jgi:hypothetical protein
MLDCFLLLRHAGSKWIPLVAIPGVTAGVVASVHLILSGIKGIISEPSCPKRRVRRTDSPERVLRWIAKRPLPDR